MSGNQSQSSSDDDVDYHTCDEDDEQESGDPRAASPSSSSSDDGRDWLDYHHSSDDEENMELDVLGAAAPAVAVKKETRQIYTRSITGLDQVLLDVLCEDTNRQLVPTSGSHQAGDALAAAIDSSSGAGFSGTLIQVNFNQTQQQFGDVTVEKATNINQSFGGRQNISKTATFHEERKDSTPSRADVINNRTLNRFKTWNEGMVKTAALDKVLEKLTEGTTWLTIKGNPGEGKTTVGYMALEELHRLGRKVFEVRSPDEFTEVTSTCARPVIMLDDVFGNLEFDHIKWSNWEPVVSTLLREREHKSHVNYIGPADMDVTVIVTGRGYVLNSASIGLGRLSDFLTSDKYLVCMDHSVNRSFEEKLAIWESISRSSGVELKQTTVDEILNIEVAHGFPHVCRLFITIFKEENTVSAVEFFRKPLQFLNLSVSKFFKDESKVGLFKEMMKGGGEVSMRKLSELDPTYKIKQTATSLVGSYLKYEDGSFSFDHPSIYDSVSFNMCALEPEFVIKHCDLSFIHERVRLQSSQKTKSVPRSESSFVVYVDLTYADDMAERFADEIMKENILQVLSHQAFTDGTFVSKVMSKMKTPLTSLFRQYVHWFMCPNTFLSCLPSSKSPELLKYIDNFITLSQDEIDSVMYGICKFAASQVLTYLINTRRSPDINKRFETAENETLLMIAAQTKDIKFVHQILSLKPDLSARDRLQKTALHYLCKNGLVSAVTRVIESGADIDVKDKVGMSALCEACTSNQLDVVKLLIEKGAKILEMSLYSAAFSGNFNIVELLCEKEPTLNNKTVLNRCLPGAVHGDNVEIMRLFLDKGASVNTSDSNMLPLHAATVFNKPQALKWLLQQGAQIDRVNNDGNTALHMAVFWGHKRCVDVLLEANAAMDLKNTEGITALHNSVLPESADCVHLLIRKGASVNTQDKRGNTPLHMLTRFGSIEYIERLEGTDKAHCLDKHGKTTFNQCVNKLLEEGAEVNIPNEDGNTALHHAVSQYKRRIPDEAVCEMLIQNGAIVNMQNNNGDTPLHLLCRSHPDFKYHETSIQTWVRAHYRNLVRLLIVSGADVDQQNTEGNTALHNAISKQSEECVNVLVRYGASVNTQDKGGNTSLHILAKLGLSEVVYMLRISPIRSLENVENCKTALHKSAKILDILLEGGADVNKTNKDGNTALHHAVSPCFPVIPDLDVCQMLIQNGAGINLQNKDGDTPLHLLYRSTPNLQSIILVINNWRTIHHKRLIINSMRSHYKNLERQLIGNFADTISKQEGEQL